MSKKQAAPEQLQPEAGEQRGNSHPPPREKPVHEIRIGRIKAVIWANYTEAGTRHNATLRRIFKRDANAPWEQSDNYGRDDLLLVAEVARQAALWIFENGQAS
jgi:hypothetical protein